MLADILPVLQAHRPGDDWWTFGGGTALGIQLGHRISYDIDIFLDSSRDLKALTPNANPLVRALLNGRPYEYPGYYLKLRQDGGEIDIIVATPQSDPGWNQWQHAGYPVRIETPVEIALKKVFYRPSTFKIRDIFDVAAVIDHGHGETLRTLMPTISDKLDLLANRVALLAPTYAERVVHDVNPTESGRRWLDPEAALPPVFDLIDDCRKAPVHAAELEQTRQTIREITEFTGLSYKREELEKNLAKLVQDLPQADRALLTAQENQVIDRAAQRSKGIGR